MTTYHFGEPVTVVRAGTPVGTVHGGIDAELHRLYLPPDADVQQNDLVLVRGATRRVVEPPWSWFNPFTGWHAGVVAKYEEAPAGLPDQGTLRRPAYGDVLVDVDGNVSREAGTLLWTGPCSVEPSPREPAFPSLADERMSVLPFLVKAGLDLVDVRPDDIFQVTQSRDGRLLVRALYVTAVRASSTGPYRELLCRDNQG